MFFHGNNVHAEAPLCCAIYTWPFLLKVFSRQIVQFKTRSIHKKKGRQLFPWAKVGFHSHVAVLRINLLASDFFFNFSTTCTLNVNNTGTKYVIIMKQTAFWREKNGDYTPCLKYSVPICVELIYKMQLWRLAVRYVNYSWH